MVILRCIRCEKFVEEDDPKIIRFYAGKHFICSDCLFKDTESKRKRKRELEEEWDKIERERRRLFVPLKSEAFYWFRDHGKCYEIRGYGPRWIKRPLTES